MRGDGAGEDVDEDWPPQDERVVCDDDDDDFPLREGSYIPEDGHQRWAEGSTTHQGAPGLPGAPRWVVPTWWPPSGVYWLKYSSNNP